MARKPTTVAFWCGKLPHWEIEEGRYFVTIHLAGAVPQVGRRRIRILAEEYRRAAQRASSDAIDLNRKIFAEMEKWLDRAPASRQLGVPAVARMIEEAIENRVTRGIWKMFEYVVMPSHLHLFFELLQPGLRQTLETFKRWTGHEAAKLFPLRGPRFWQQEWFDHWSRSDAEDERIAAYIRRNPVAAGLCNDYLAWPYGSWSLR